MKRILIVITAVIFLFLITIPEAMAQGRMGGQAAGCCGGQGQRGGTQACCQHSGNGSPSSEPLFAPPIVEDNVENKASDDLAPEPSRPVVLETVTGAVTDVYRVAAKQGKSEGLHLLLRTSEQTVDVHLGPTHYLERQMLNLERGVFLAITGEWMPTKGLAAMRAFEVKQGDATLMLRHADGTPVWQGWRSPLEEPA